MQIREIRTGRVVNVPVAIAALFVGVGRHEYVTESFTPEQEISPRTGKPKRQYKRRDMKAEE